MRFLILFAALASAATAARADSRESRYGPAPDRPPTALNAASGYAGPVLSWGGKATPAPIPAPAERAVVAPARYAPVQQPIQQPPQPLYEPWRQLGARPASPPQAQAAPAQVAPLAAPTPTVQADAPLNEPWRRLGARPETVQGQGEGQVQAQTRTTPVQAAAIRPAQPALAAAPHALPTSIYQDAPQAQPPVQAYAQARAPTQPPPAAQPALGPSMSRTYSVGRQYGLQPDGIPPLQPNGMVFIAPSDEPAPSKKEEPRHGSAEWLAQAPLDAASDDDAKRDDAKDSAL